MVHESVAVVLASVEPPDIWQTSKPFDTGVFLRRPLPRRRFPQEIASLIKVLIRPSWSLNHLYNPPRRPAILCGETWHWGGAKKDFHELKGPTGGMCQFRGRRYLSNLWKNHQKRICEGTNCLWRLGVWEIIVSGVPLWNLILSMFEKTNATNHGVIFP